MNHAHMHTCKCKHTHSHTCAHRCTYTYACTLAQYSTHTHTQTHAHAESKFLFLSPFLPPLSPSLSRTQWKKCTFSGDGEFIVAGSHRQHALYIWDKGTGSLAKMLTGQKGETLLDIAVSGSCDNHMLNTSGELL